MELNKSGTTGSTPGLLLAPEGGGDGGLTDVSVVRLFDAIGASREQEQSSGVREY